MRKRSKVHALLVNPIVIILPLVALLWFGWVHFLAANRGLAAARHNMLPGSSFTTVSSSGVPPAWSLAQNGDLNKSVVQTNGYVNGKSLQVKVTDYRDGDLELLTPKVTVDQHTDYLFKSFYTANTNFELLVHYYYHDGQDDVELLKSYPSNGSSWSTVSTAFNSGDNIKAVQVIYRLSSNGHLRLNNPFLEVSPNVYLASAPSSIRNYIPNGDLSVAHGSVPENWSSYRTGNNGATFTYAHQASRPFVGVNVSNYKSGEAKWQYTPQNVTPFEEFTFGVSYRASVRADVVAEYELTNHQRQFYTLATLSPASEWTDVSIPFEVPDQASTLFVSVVLHQTGSVATSKYSLTGTTTQPNPLTWSQPMVSLAFDDGWESAYQNAWPLLKQAKLPSTFYINPGTIDTKHFMADSQIKSLAASGNEIASGGYDRLDMTTLDTKRLDAELEKATTYITQNFGKASADFAAPYGLLDPQVEFYAHKYYHSELGNLAGINTLQNYNPYNLRVLEVGHNTPISTIQKALEQTKQSNGWLIIVYHQIATKPQPGTPTITPNAFASQLQTIQESDVNIQTLAKATALLNTKPSQPSIESASIETSHAVTKLSAIPALPNTGPQDIVALFLGAAIGGTSLYSIISTLLMQHNKTK